MSKRALDAAGIKDQRLRSAYEESRKLLITYDTSFYLAGLMLPLWKRPYSHALYGLARYVDQMIDQADIAREEKIKKFDEWTKTFQTDLKNGYSDDLIVHAFLHTVRTWDISSGLVQDFLDVIQTDLTVTQYKTFDDLEKYMYGSASTWALQALPIMGYTDDKVLESVRVFGLALQFTNILRDISEDLDLGRIYIPIEDMEKFDVQPEDFYKRQVTDGIRELLKFEISRARQFYTQAQANSEALHPASRVCTNTAIVLYSGILDAIEANDYQVFTKRASIGNLRRVRIGIPAYVKALVAQYRHPTVPIKPAQTHTQ